MSFKIIISFFAFLIFAGCGVKSKPLNPPEKAIKSYTESYTGPTLDDDKSKKSSTKKK